MHSIEIGNRIMLTHSENNIKGRLTANFNLFFHFLRCLICSGNINYLSDRSYVLRHGHSQNKHIFRFFFVKKNILHEKLPSFYTAIAENKINIY